MTFNFGANLLQKIHAVFNNDGIIAYPTEAVFGLGCDPFNEKAVRRILAIKQRAEAQGLILIASAWHQFNDLIETPSAEQLEKVKATWPGPVTWLFPVKSTAPRWIVGDHNSVAIRMTAHPIARAICQAVDQVIVSTSANISGQSPCKTMQEVQDIFGDNIDLIIPGLVGDLANPTGIRDAVTGKVIRGQ